MKRKLILIAAPIALLGGLAWFVISDFIRGVSPEILLSSPLKGVITVKTSKPLLLLVGEVGTIDAERFEKVLQLYLTDNSFETISDRRNRDGTPGPARLFRQNSGLELLITTRGSGKTFLTLNTSDDATSLPTELRQSTIESFGAAGLQVGEI